MLSVLSDPLAHLLGMTLRPGEILKRRIVIALPGSEGAVRLAMSKLVLPELAHLVQQANR